MNRLTASQENYLKAIFLLSQGKKGVRQIDIAHHLHISRPSACAAAAKLEKNGFVARNASRLVALTPDGEREAERIIDSFTVINLFLTDRLNVAPHTARMDAGSMEHVTSAETVNALRLLLGGQCRYDKRAVQ